jgi:hypothetical protein
MVKCNDCWCEYYDKSKGNCDTCLKNEEAKDKPELSVILKRRAAKQMEIDKKSNSKGQSNGIC